MRRAGGNQGPPELELIGQVAENGKGEWVEPLKQAFDEVEKDEDRHLYHIKGWTRELWVEALGLHAAGMPRRLLKT